MIPVDPFQLGIALDDPFGSFPAWNTPWFHEGTFCIALISHFLGELFHLLLWRSGLPVGPVNSHSHLLLTPCIPPGTAFLSPQAICHQDKIMDTTNRSNFWQRWCIKAVQYLWELHIAHYFIFSFSWSALNYSVIPESNSVLVFLCLGSSVKVTSLGLFERSFIILTLNHICWRTGTQMLCGLDTRVKKM